VRNSVGQDFNPKDKTLWFTDNQTDGMGDDTPPGELNRSPSRPALRLPVHARQERQDRRHVGGAGPEGHEGAGELVPPQIEFPAHQAQLGMAFYDGKMFRRSTRAASSCCARLVEPHYAHRRAGQLRLAEGRRHGDRSEVFRRGWLDPNTTPIAAGRSTWRDEDGSLLVSDDYAGPSTDLVPAVGGCGPVVWLPRYRCRDSHPSRAGRRAGRGGRQPQGGRLSGVPRPRWPVAPARRSPSRGPAGALLGARPARLSDGERRNEVMSIAARTLSEQDIRDLAPTTRLSRSASRPSVKRIHAATAVAAITSERRSRRATRRPCLRWSRWWSRPPAASGLDWTYPPRST